MAVEEEEEEEVITMTVAREMEGTIIAEVEGAGHEALIQGMTEDTEEAVGWDLMDRGQFFLQLSGVPKQTCLCPITCFSFWDTFKKYCADSFSVIANIEQDDRILFDTEIH